MTRRPACFVFMLALLFAAPVLADAPPRAERPPQAAIASANAYATDAGMEILQGRLRRPR